MTRWLSKYDYHKTEIKHFSDMLYIHEKMEDIKELVNELEIKEAKKLFDNLRNELDDYVDEYRNINYAMDQ